jgi:predicted nucleotide-binding protein
MDSMIEELRNIYDQLQSFVEKANKNDTIKSLEKLEASAGEVGKSWSGSWLGYQSRIYYKDFISVPAGAHFSSEWGTYQNITQDTCGDWVECQFDYVKGYIKSKAGNPDTKKAKSIAKDGQGIFEENFSAVLSIFETYLLRRKDSFVESLVEKVKAIEISAGSDWIDTVRPHGSIMSRDSLATSQGLWTPPHISIIAEIFEIRSIIYVCETLAKHVKTATSHIERQEKEARKMGRVGANIFIGHGRSLLWKELKDFIQDRLRLPWDEFNRVPVAGVSNILRLSEMLDSAVIAFIVMTAEDEQPDGKLRARMNVVHEAGLFQGRLGFSRAIVLLEEGCEEFSNIQGLGQIRFPKGNIKAAFEEIRQVLEREGIVNSQINTN